MLKIAYCDDMKIDRDKIMSSLSYIEEKWEEIRTYAGGYHCQKAINCYLMSSGVILLILGVVKFTPIEYMIIIGIIMLFVAIPILIKFAPMETPNKPLDEDEQKYYRKKMIIRLGIECLLETV